MAAEARRLQERADFEARVLYVSTYSSTAEADLPTPAVDNQSLEDMELEDSQEYFNDVDELWQEIDEHGRLLCWQPPPNLPVADPKDTVEATALLSKFRPARGAVEDLKKLLAAGADPNITLSGGMHPLSKVMTFAHADRVGPMRDLLLQAGAVESEDAKEQWKIRHRADACEEAWMRNFHRDPR